MNSKLAKELRRETGHHHTVPTGLVEAKHNGARGSHLIVNPKTSKGRYKALKKEVKGGKK